MSRKGRDQLPVPPGFANQNSRQTKLLYIWQRYKPVIGLSIALLITVIGSFIFMPFIEGATSTYQIERVSRGPLQVVVNATGLLQSPVYNLSFQNSAGTISEIDVQQGQKVTAGQVLARLDSSTLQASVTSAQITVSTARDNLRATLAHAGNTLAAINAAIAVAEASFRAARANQSAAYKQANTTLDDARITLETDQSNLDATYKAANAQLRAAEDQMKQSLTSCQTSANISNTSSSSSTPTPTSAQLSLEICQQAAKTQYKQTAANTHTSITTAAGQVKKDQKAFYQALANVDASLTNTYGQTSIARHQVISTADNADKTAAYAQVVSTQGQFQVALSQLDIATQNLAGATLRAPHDGVVTAINGTIGGLPGITDNIAYGGIGSAAGGAFIQLVDLSHTAKFLLNVDETDIAKIEVGQRVQFTLKAYKNHQFTGTIDAISPNGTTTNGITYPVIVTIDPQSIEGLTILPNMTANATVTVVDNSHALRVPANSASFTDAVDKLPKNNGRTLVSKQAIDVALNQAHSMLIVLNKSKPELRAHEPCPAFVIEQSSTSDEYHVQPVILGLSDGKYFEVLQGLVEGEHLKPLLSS